MKYILYNVQNINGEAVVTKIDENTTLPLDSWAEYERWFQQRISKLRSERELYQVVAWTTGPASEGAFIGMELVQSGVIGPFRILIQ